MPKSYKPDTIEPVDLKLKIGNKEEVFWHEVVAQTTIDIEKHEKSLTFLREVVRMAKRKEGEARAQHATG